MRKLTYALFTLLIVPSFALAQLSPEDTGLETTGDEVYGSLGEETLATWVGQYIINPAISLIGVIFLLLMIYGGFLWMTAGGNEGQVKKAKDVLITAIIGTIIITAAYAITNFVFTALT